MKKIIIILVAMIGVILLEAIALMKGIDGALLMSALTLIGGLGGYELKDIQNRIEVIKRD